MEIVLISVIIGWGITLIGVSIKIGTYKNRLESVESEVSELRKESKETYAQFTELKVALARVEALLEDIRSRFDGVKK